MDYEIIEDDEIMTALLPVSTCPVCEYKLDAATSISDVALPQENDISICINCTSVLAFRADGTLRKLTSDENSALPAELVHQLEFVRSKIQGKTH
jgi:hypothetical protein